MGINIFQVNAFTNKAFGGNPAGVVPNATNMTDEEMQMTAREMNVSETAFINKLSEDYYEVRFFTPKAEVELCGHATISAFFILAKKRYITPIEQGIKTVYQETKLGSLPVYLHYDKGEVFNVSMEQAEPKDYGIIKNIDMLSRALSVDVEDMGLEGVDLMPRIVSTGLKDIVVGVKSKKNLDDINIDKKLLTDISIKNDVVGVHVFHMPDLNGNEVYARNFTPRFNRYEESATGTPNGGLIYLLKKKGILKGNTLISNQGESINRMSKIFCEITDDNRVLVTGEARLSLDGILMLV